MDSMGRVTEKLKEDCYICPISGKLRPLIFACTEDLRNGPKNATWTRIYIWKVVPSAY